MTQRKNKPAKNRLSDQEFDTLALLQAVDTVDQLRDDFKDGQGGRPLQLRTDLLRLHQLAVAALNEGARSKIGDLLELAADLDDQVSDMISKLESIQEALSQLLAVDPDSEDDE
ncbi:transposase [Ahniella affigens]|uniref:Transposase n=1 Tax=Ahniella affigens TaxID=2021234 RepID=A0A2P1PQZ8_9GAMM|nr:transposase [Ahniella affigens]AVP97254.1 transposase [Ahniella affigens]